MKKAQHRIVLSLVVALGAMAYHPILFWEPAVRSSSEGAIGGFFFEPQHASAQLVYAVCAYFLFRRRHRIRAALRSPPAPLAGAPLLLLGVAQFLWSVSSGAMDLRILSLVPTALGCALILGGGPLMRAILRPVLLLLFAVPIPAVVLNQIVFPLQMWTVDLSAWMLHVLGISAAQQGDLLYARDRIFQVIESCSGMRIVSTLTLASVAYAELLERKRFYAGFLLIVSPFVGFFLNGVRVVTIVLSAGDDTSQDHTIQGIVMIVCGVLVLHAVDLGLERLLPSASRGAHPRDARQPPSPEKPLPSSSLASFLALAALGVMASSTLWLDSWQPPIPQSPWGVPLPREWAGYESRQLEVDKAFLGSVRFKRRLARAYERNGTRVEIFLGYDDLLNRWRNPISPKVGIPGSGSVVLQRRQVSLPGFPTEVERVLVQRGRDRVLSLSWLEGSRGLWTELGRGLAALDQSPGRRRSGITAVRVSTLIEPASSGEDAAEERLRRFAAELRPLVLSAEKRVWATQLRQAEARNP